MVWIQRKALMGRAGWLMAAFWESPLRAIGLGRQLTSFKGAYLTESGRITHCIINVIQPYFPIRYIRRNQF